MRQRKHYTAEQKTKILRELLENNVPISQLCEKYEVRPNDIYNRSDFVCQDELEEKTIRIGSRYFRSK
ncbi:MAG: transposase [Bacteroidetes bacterium]|nr:transposase [Bacteroidota bacterium]